MMSGLYEFFAFEIPWWLWSLPIVVGTAGVFLFTLRLLGVRNAVRATAGFLIVSAIGLVSARSRQRGWKARIRKENRDAENLIKRANKARTGVRRGSRERLYEDDGYKRD